MIGVVGCAYSNWQGWDFLVGLSGLAFIIGLVWALIRAKPAINELPDLDIFTEKRPGFWLRTLLLFLGLGLAFLLGMVISPGFSMILVCGLVGFGLTLGFRKALTRKVIGIGLILGLVSALGSALLGTGDLSWSAVYLIMVPPAFTGGVLLMQHTQLGHIRLLERLPAKVVKGFLIGCLLALPPALLELMGNMQSQDTYIIHWWQPLHAIVPGIAEETWFRLLLLSFCYAVLRPATNQRPRRAIVVAILVSIFAFTFAHSGLNPFGFLYGLLFSMPHALLFIKKDFEHAVGYHFMIDFVRYIAAFIS